MSTKSCIFCGKSLTAKNRGREHVFRKEMLRKLGHMKTSVGVRFTSLSGYDSTRHVIGNQFLAGEICNTCNSGWMNRLDKKVDKLLILLSKDPNLIAEISRGEAFDLARWLLKTACVFSCIDTPSRRHIPSSILRSVPREDYLPAEFVAFAGRSRELPTKHLAASALDCWDADLVGEISQLPRSSRHKFGVQYDGILLGCAIVMHPSFRYTCIKNLHYPFLTKSAQVLMYELPESVHANLVLDSRIQPTNLNVFLAFFSAEPLNKTSS